MTRPLSILFALTLACPLAALAADVGVSIQFSQPGMYGRIDVGQYPQPQLVVAQPIMVMPPPVAVVQPEPVYLWVPPGHRKHWEKHCREYNACGHPVYFVQDDWYRHHVMRGDDGHRGERGDRGDRHERHHDEDRGNGRGEGHDRGHGHGHGHDD